MDISSDYKKYIRAPCSLTQSCVPTLRSGPLAAFRFGSTWKEEKEERILPSLVATTNALARTKSVRTYYVRTNNLLKMVVFPTRPAQPTQIWKYMEGRKKKEKKEKKKGKKEKNNAKFSGH